jgi:hypothetical protein
MKRGLFPDNMPVTWCYPLEDNHQYCSTGFPMGCYVRENGGSQDCVISVCTNCLCAKYIYECDLHFVGQFSHLSCVLFESITCLVVSFFITFSFLLLVYKQWHPYLTYFFPGVKLLKTSFLIFSKNSVSYIVVCMLCTFLKSDFSELVTFLK